MRYSDASETTVASGRLYDATGAIKRYQCVLDVFEVPSRHFTIIFNTFVLLQFFNFFNARKIHDEFNQFEHLSKNHLFITIVSLILLLQFLIITFGGIVFSCYSSSGGLTLRHWLICLALGSLSLVMRAFLRLLPEDRIPKKGVFKED